MLQIIDKPTHFLPLTQLCLKDAAFSAFLFQKILTNDQILDLHSSFLLFENAAVLLLLITSLKPTCCSVVVFDAPIQTPDFHCLTRIESIQIKVSFN